MYFPPMIFYLGTARTSYCSTGKFKYFYITLLAFASTCLAECPVAYLFTILTPEVTYLPSTFTCSNMHTFPYFMTFL